MLLLQKNEPVSREELFETCWEGLVVTDQALTNVVSGLRRNLLSLKAQKRKSRPSVKSVILFKPNPLKSCYNQYLRLQSLLQKPFAILRMKE